MRVFISGISGTGMGPLALMAKAAGLEVCGSDLAKGAIYDEIVQAGIEVKIGPQDGKFLSEQLAGAGIDWFVYTSALPDDHAELTQAQRAGLRCTKRDDFTAFLIQKLGLKLVAVAGTHGKTTTTAMLVWATRALQLPAAYIVGTTLGFAPAGAYHQGDQFFIYEADEYDRNFLKFHPWLAILPAVSYDHPDIYPTREDYAAAFQQFKNQSHTVIDGTHSLPHAAEFTIAGKVRRHDAALALAALQKIAPHLSPAQIIQTLNTFPGAGRRFERLAEGIYTDYAHHPEEIAATLDIAQDEKQLKGYTGITVVYQPHQNTRQHEVRAGYQQAFYGADKIYWLPTYLTREDPSLPVLTPAELIADLANSAVAEPAELGSGLLAKIQAARAKGQLVILMTAGPADQWLREELAK